MSCSAQEGVLSTVEQLGGHVILVGKNMWARKTISYLMQAIARVSQKRQVVIPPEMRRKLHVSKLVVITEEDGLIVMKPAMSLEDAFGIEGTRMREVAREIVEERSTETESERAWLPHRRERPRLVFRWRRDGEEILRQNLVRKGGGLPLARELGGVLLQDWQKFGEDVTETRYNLIVSSRMARVSTSDDITKRG